MTTDLDLAGTWQGLSRTWNSGSNTSVVLSLINRNTGALGNDFAIDDVYFGTRSTVTPYPSPRHTCSCWPGSPPSPSPGAAVADETPAPQRKPPATAIRSPVIPAASERGTRGDRRLAEAAERCR